jgi:excisionase family DNA binding protein
MSSKMVLRPTVPDSATEPTVTVERAGALLGISRGSAYAAAAAGDIPTIRVGRRLLVPTAALRRLLGLDAQPTDRGAA